MADTRTDYSTSSRLSARAKFAFLVLVGCLALALLAACGGSSGGNSASSSSALKDGTYEGQSSVLDAGVDGDGYAIVSVTIEDGKIVDAAMQAYQPDGTPKDADYGKDGSRYAVAQKVIATGDDYVNALVEAGSLDGVDAISGATYLYEQFVEATEDALSQASK